MKAISKSAGTVCTILALLLVLAACRANRAVSADAPAEVEEARKLIALTFDDGPHRSTTTELLDGLAQRGAHATFFLIGKQIEGSEDLIRRMDEEGHQIGMHTFDHVILTGLNRVDFDAQVEKSRQLLENIVSHGGFPLRPPYGLYDEHVRAMAECPIILWNVDPEDWRGKNADRIAQHIISHAEDGAVVLLHDIYPTSVEAALRAVDTLQAQGFQFVTVEELFCARGIEPEDGEAYLNADWKADYTRTAMSSGSGAVSSSHAPVNGWSSESR